MPTFPGPWITDPPTEYTLTFDWWGGSHDEVPWGQWRGIGTDFAAACDAGSPGGLFQVMTIAAVAGATFGGETDYDGNPVTRGDLMGYQQESLRFSFTIDAFDALPNIDGFDLPPGAIDF